MAKLSLEDIEFIKILATSDSTILQLGMNDATKSQLNDRIGTVLREYYRENTMGFPTGWNQEFEKAGISEDDGKAAIACARRLGIDIS
ncbi:hypothetical protein NsoK4_04295 [Nitrosopumilus sp. K4]|uniref:hypothetical protein n=1 Tax=Nitrosopumilus sp. K4 TaxID=2795383 RepID=UPI001BAA9A73|nr:hypothetical protein [Nitrosopumilus sp. K4]QUC65469.1 hypothetical protein NsoK4_04295 [Nitrosopumilus sp. K4]